MHRQFLRLLTLALVVFCAVPALAQYTRDAAANRKIDEAINTHYLATDFDKAESVLTGTIKACEDKCSPGTLAKAWMYVGIVRGSGRNDQAGAKEAFQTAIATDPNVKLDAGLATPETQATFAQSGGGGSVETPTTPAGKDVAPIKAEPAGVGGLVCSPDVTEVETRRPIPVQCKVDEEVTAVELRYRPFGEETWKTLRMEHKGQSFRAQIPCDATQTPGILKLYVSAKNQKGAEVLSWGGKAEPIEIQLAERSAAPPPSYDDAEPPPRCAAKEICPPDFPGCDSGGGSKGSGVSCSSSSECKAGLVCLDGTCESAPSCSTDADCPNGSCMEGKCSADGGMLSARPKKWWVGLHIAQDLPFIGGDNVCLPNSSTGNWSCYVSGSTDQPYDTGHFRTQQTGKIGTGAVAGTTRILLSIERVLTANIMGGVRIGYALRGGPPASRKVTYGSGEDYLNVVSVNNEGSKFLPFHFEVRGSYWFGKNVFAKRGLRPYVLAGAGLAQVDAKVVVKTRECNNPTALDPDVPGCGTNGTTEYTADAWKKLGRGFIEVGGGAVYAFSPKMGVQLNLNLMYMLPSSGIVPEPSLGMVFGL